MPWVIPFFAAAVDRLYWAIYKRRDMVVPPKDGGPVGPWISALISGVAGAAGAFAINRLTGQMDLFTLVVGAVIGGRLVCGAIDTVRR